MGRPRLEIKEDGSLSDEKNGVTALGRLNKNAGL
jgi:hypothetical protein